MFSIVAFVPEISPKLSGGFGCYRYEWVNPIAPRVYAWSYYFEHNPTIRPVIPVLDTIPKTNIKRQNLKESYLKS